ncbi:hypothetical protein ABZX62_28770 [Streptomyces flavidovirens]|uniref:hypothetical protein n=1 Tax=Streptomyces flavidovirens TaxID=67298 RepID=UPI0033A411D8
MDDELRRRLRDAAAAHRPDRERMLARVERGMAGHAPQKTWAACHPVAPWLRIVGATAAVAGVFAVGGYGVAAAVRGGEPNPQTVAATPTPTDESAPEQPTATPEPDRPSTLSTVSASPAPSTPPAGDTTHTVPAAELLGADGSIDPGSSAYWGQSNITVKVKKPLTELTVELYVADKDSPKDTGNWRSLPADDFEVSVRASRGACLYRWTLKDGRTVPAGEHVFAGQYNHTRGQRDAGNDSYTVLAGTGSEQARWKGDFA